MSRPDTISGRWYGHGQPGSVSGFLLMRPIRYRLIRQSPPAADKPPGSAAVDGTAIDETAMAPFLRNEAH